MTLADRLNLIVREQKLSKAEFARRLGISVNYVYILTGSSRKKAGRNQTISLSLAKLITSEFGYDTNWILRGE